VRQEEPPKHAFFGVRACELAAMAILDRVTASELLDPYYRSARDRAFKVAVNCTAPGGTCFCASMGTGPRCTRDFDLCLTELDGELAIEVGSEPGAALFQRLESREASASERRLFELLMERAAEHMGRRLERTACRSCCGTASRVRAGKRSPNAVWPVPTARWCVRPVSVTTCRTTPI
jgi:sulfhydrogenase subunit beta (sulfur reductase)